MARNKYKKRQQEELNKPAETTKEESVDPTEQGEEEDGEPINIDKGIVKLGLLAVIAATLFYKGFLQTGNATANETANIAANTQPINTATALSTNPNNPVTATIPPPTTEKANTPPSNAPATSVKFDNPDHSFGTIKQHSSNKHVFKFTNTGNYPLIINSALGSCGCTAPTFPKEPIPPGETGEIEVVYKPGTQKGKQKKSVTVTANTQPDKTYLIIAADVEEAPDPKAAQ